MKKLYLRWSVGTGWNSKSFFLHNGGNFNFYNNGEIEPLNNYHTVYNGEQKKISKVMRWNDKWYDYNSLQIYPFLLTKYADSGMEKRVSFGSCYYSH